MLLTKDAASHVSTFPAHQHRLLVLQPPSRPRRRARLPAPAPRPASDSSSVAEVVPCLGTGRGPRPCKHRGMPVRALAAAPVGRLSSVIEAVRAGRSSRRLCQVPRPQGAHQVERRPVRDVRFRAGAPEMDDGGMHSLRSGTTGASGNGGPPGCRDDTERPAVGVRPPRLRPPAAQRSLPLTCASCTCPRLFLLRLGDPVRTCESPPSVRRPCLPRPTSAPLPLSRTPASPASLSRQDLPADDCVAHAGAYAGTPCASCASRDASTWRCSSGV